MPNDKPGAAPSPSVPAMTPLSNEHPMMKAWDEFCATDEFKSALRWAVETKYDDGRPIQDIQREQHAKGAMWLALTKGMEVAHADDLEKLHRKIAGAKGCDSCSGRGYNLRPAIGGNFEEANCPHCVNGIVWPKEEA